MRIQLVVRQLAMAITPKTLSNSWGWSTMPEMRYDFGVRCDTRTCPECASCVCQSGRWSTRRKPLRDFVSDCKSCTPLQTADIREWNGFASDFQELYGSFKLCCEQPSGFPQQISGSYLNCIQRLKYVRQVRSLSSRCSWYTPMHLFGINPRLFD